MFRWLKRLAALPKEHKFLVQSAIIQEKRLQSLQAHVMQLVLDTRLLLDRMERLMHLSQESKDLLAEINTATNDVAAKIEALLAKPNTTEAEFREALAPIRDKLKAMAADPDNPVP